MTAKYIKSDDAVSPVIGVMLMLVVTIIIAALVSAFAGGLAETQDAPTSLTLKATYSQADGMTITHAGGDTASLTNLKFLTTPSEAMGPDHLQFEHEIPKFVLNYTTEDGESTQVMNTNTGVYYKAAFIPGDTLTISHKYCNDYATDEDLEGASKSSPYYTGGEVNKNAQLNWGSPESEKAVYFRSYQFGAPQNVGNYFYLTTLGSNGNVISKQKVTITA
jgi:FlaG/FlaF family flagellin (archaellin)